MRNLFGSGRSILAAALTMLFALVQSTNTIGVAVAASSEDNGKLRSLKPEAVLTKLNSETPGLEGVKAREDEGDHSGALAALLEHYRVKYPLDEPTGDISEGNLKNADRIVDHIFQWGPYEPADYGETVNWEWDPRGDIEWVAAMYRFHWAGSLTQAFAETRDEKYAEAFVDLTRDWISKHPLEEHTKTHYVYTNWRGYAWLDIQTGIRATHLCGSFLTMVHAEAFTPEFLGVFLASMYDHQTKTELLPMGRVHNKAVFEQRGFINIAYTFTEFRDSRRWMELALGRVRETFLAQVTADGVQREWSGGYHSGVLSDAVEIMGRMDTFDIPIPDDYRERVRGMYDYIFGIATPELDYPMFGDTGRSIKVPADRSRWQLYPALVKATELFGDPKYAALATLDRAALPGQTCYAFREAGMYALRNDWGSDQIYFALHCSPPAISSHDQPDNGTFELRAYGRWLMTDSGYYTYGHDPDGRAWHRRTRVHQTLTLDGNDSKINAKALLWHSSPGLAVVAVENPSYDGLTHRRTVWFVDGLFFVLLDEAIGDAPGALDLHFQLAVGDAKIGNHQVMTCFDDVNVLVWQDPKAPVTMAEEEGWFAWKYGHREPRTAFRFRHNDAAPAAFLTLLVPYHGREAPEVAASLPAEHEIGGDRVELHVQAFGKAWRIGRDLERRTAWRGMQ